MNILANQMFKYVCIGTSTRAVDDERPGRQLCVSWHGGRIRGARSGGLASA
jgi:hypothetical protein